LKNELGAGGRQFHSSTPGAKLPSYATVFNSSSSLPSLALNTEFSSVPSGHLVIVAVEPNIDRLQNSRPPQTFRPTVYCLDLSYTIEQAWHNSF